MARRPDSPRYGFVLLAFVAACIGSPPSGAPGDTGAANLGTPDAAPEDSTNGGDDDVSDGSPGVDAEPDLAEAGVPPDARDAGEWELPERPAPVSACGIGEMPVPLLRWDMETVDGAGNVANTGWAQAPPLDASDASLEPGVIGNALVLHEDAPRTPHILDHPAFRELEQGTLTVWVKFTDAALNDTRAGGVFSKDAKNQGSEHFELEESSGTMHFRLQHRDGREVDLYSNQLTASKWYHASVTWAEGQSQLFVDGVLVDTEPAGWSIAQNFEPVGVGFSTGNSDDGALGAVAYMDGGIDEIAVWTEVLPVETIQALSAGCSSPGL